MPCEKKIGFEAKCQKHYRSNKLARSCGSSYGSGILKKPEDELKEMHRRSVKLLTMSEWENSINYCWVLGNSIRRHRDEFKENWNWEPSRIVTKCLLPWHALSNRESSRQLKRTNNMIHTQGVKSSCKQCRKDIIILSSTSFVLV